MLSTLAFLALSSLKPIAPLGQGWLCYGGNAQHSGVFTGVSQAASGIRWQASLDDDRNYYGGDVLIHYASPMVSPANTVVYGYRFTVSGAHDNWRVVGRSGATGSQSWQMDTDYSAALIWPNDWTTVFPVTLFQLDGGQSPAGVAAAAAAGSILVRPSADSSQSTVTRYVFYTSLDDFNSHRGAYAPVKINTPLTADGNGNIFFGYEVSGAVPPNLASLGSGGIARVNVTTGATAYASVQTLGIDPTLSRPAMNAAPALSVDGSTMYVALTGGKSMLARLDASTFTVTAKVQLMDPSIGGAGAYLVNESSGSPMIGPDGHVFMGVFGNQWRESHGWMLQFDANLSQTNGSGKRLPVGAFGWDDTATVVPAHAVPSYTGSSPYLILTKYNNYDDNGSDPGADGSNRVGVIDPGSDSKTKDRQSGIPVMNEVITVLGPTRTNDDPSHPDARHEWCINSAAIDVNGRAAIINSEDGKMYRWSFVTNTLSETMALQPPTGEAYTSTVIGPDGQLYAINNSILFALGSARATAVSVYQGTAGTGQLSDIWSVDGRTYSCGSVSITGFQAAAIEADFALPSGGQTFNVTAYASGAPGVTGFLYAYDYSAQAFQLIASRPLGASITPITGSAANASRFIGPGGKVRVLVRGTTPVRTGGPPFTLAVDEATCGSV
ncbi:MAG TPA: hypothetical protein VKT78_02350 [Fimbriimonadaceae bacterium]|nr:hypothetical protein [Fimbriimonadaceae bacterium]